MMREAGVIEAVIVPEDGVAYLKIDSEHADDIDLDKFSGRPVQA